MSVIVRRCVFNKCLDLARNNSRSIVIGDGQVNKSLNDCRRASTVCSRQALSLPIGSYANTAASTNCTSIRFYSYKRGGKGSGSKHDDRDSDEDTDDEMAQYSEPGTKDRNLIRIKVQSLRLDLLIKSVLRMSRNKIETSFYESKIRVNGKKIAKKSISIREGDEIDVIKSFSPDNPENLVIARIEMLSARVDNEEEHIIIVARRFKSLTIENYPGADCYKSSDVDDAS